MANSLASEVYGHLVKLLLSEVSPSRKFGPQNFNNPSMIAEGKYSYITERSRPLEISGGQTF